jgi:hypothetical protein
MSKIQIIDLPLNISNSSTDLVYLSNKELGLINGGLQITPGTSVQAALRTFPGLGYVLGAFTGGYQFGQWLNANTGIQNYLSSLY